VKQSVVPAFLAALLISGAVLAVSASRTMAGNFGQWDYDQKKYGSMQNYEQWLKELLRDLCHAQEPTSPYKKPGYQWGSIDDLAELTPVNYGTQVPEFCKWIDTYKFHYY
jgi:hypothetical protein